MLLVYASYIAVYKMKNRRNLQVADSRNYRIQPPLIATVTSAHKLVPLSSGYALVYSRCHSQFNRLCFQDILSVTAFRNPPGFRFHYHTDHILQTFYELTTEIESLVNGLTSVFVTRVCRFWLSYRCVFRLFFLKITAKRV